MLVDTSFSSLPSLFEAILFSALLALLLAMSDLQRSLYIGKMSDDCFAAETLFKYLPDFAVFLRLGLLRICAAGDCRSSFGQILT